MKKVAILQSNYIPWKGYFDLINSVDDFVIYDTSQYTTRDWRNRNRIYTPEGVKWLTIPVKGTQSKRINEIEIADPEWGKKHWSTIKYAYGKAPFFIEYSHEFESLYMDADESRLSAINFKFITLINKLLGIETKLFWSSDFDLADERTSRLLGICEQLNADIYVSGPSAKEYLDEKKFDQNGITVEWMDYSDYPEYSQLHEPFEHQVSVLDLLFNAGPDAVKYMKTF